MLTARSPTRSRSVLIFTAATIARRSAAIGWYSASSVKQRLSTSMCSAFSGSSPARTRSMSVVVALDQAFDGQADLLLRQPAHFEQPRLELFELLLEMPDDALRPAPSSRTFP